MIPEQKHAQKNRGEHDRCQKSRPKQQLWGEPGLLGRGAREGGRL